MKDRMSGRAAMLLLAGAATAAPGAMAGDWWIVYGRGDKPQREMFLADAATLQDIPGQDAKAPARGARFIQVFEGADQPDYLAYEFQVQCKPRQYRLASVVAHQRDGTELAVPLTGQPADQWTVLKKRSSLQAEQHLRFVCDEARKRERNMMLQVGQAEPDRLLVGIWGTMWQDGARPQVQRKSREELTRAKADKAADLLKVFEGE